MNIYNLKSNSASYLSYTLYENQIDGTVHLLITNSSYLLIDYLISP